MGGLAAAGAGLAGSAGFSAVLATSDIRFFLPGFGSRTRLNEQVLRLKSSAVNNRTMAHASLLQISHCDSESKGNANHGMCGYGTKKRDFFSKVEKHAADTSCAWERAE
jgi:hypothetical protein